MEKKKRIILYEEDEIFGSLLKEYLKTKGFRCDLFLDDLMGWEIFKEKIYDICIIDLTQTFNGGYDLV
ncbi:MAG: DNA-binding response regulator, partial [Bacteroidales bacterium]